MVSVKRQCDHGLIICGGIFLKKIVYIEYCRTFYNIYVVLEDLNTY